LVGNIDFSGNQGKGEEGKDWQNYANYCISQGQCTSMILGIVNFDYGDVFNKIFDGQGFTLKNINIDTTQLADKPKFIGIFGSTRNATFKNINVDYMGGGIKGVNTDSLYAGGFAGYTSGNFSNISLSNIGNISVSTNYRGSSAGGFVGYASGSFSNISLSNIGNISASSSSNHGPVIGSSYAGGFTGNNFGNFSNISLSNIGNISASSSSNYGSSNAGGFSGYSTGKHYNISLENIGDITSDSSFGEANSGGYAGEIYGGNFSNISLSNIGNISSKSGNIGTGFYNSASGGFAGLSSVRLPKEVMIFENIFLNGIGNISSSSRSYGFASIIGGFIGGIKPDNGEGEVTFSNIFIYFNPNVIFITTPGKKSNLSKFTNVLYNFNNKPTFSNIHIYHHEKDLANATADKNYWNDFNKNGYVFDKINIHTYTDKTQANAYKDFLSKANTIEKPTITPPTTPDNPNKPSDNDVILTSDDLHQDIIQGIIDSIRNEKYTIDIKNLYSLIQAFKGLNKDSNENEIKTIVKTHLGIKDDDKALSIAQSISFLLHYNEINFNNKLDKTALELYNNQIKPNVFNTLEIITYLDTNKNDIIAQLQQYESIKNDFKIKEQAYFKAQAEFNKLLDLVNKGKLNYNDPKFTQAFDNWTKAYNAYNSLSNDIGELNSKVNQYTQYINTTLGYKQFAFVKFDNIIKTDLTKPILPDIDNS
ncbi:methylenetetrahydrofolate reductase, partial [Campylobacter peloridis]|uniref:methylenetetrahydrofolate reductase n=1 Tax=Campylobacter peloridis TaxID=488546 RepID=UPI001C731DF1